MDRKVTKSSFKEKGEDQIVKSEFSSFQRSFLENGIYDPLVVELLSEQTRSQVLNIFSPFNIEVSKKDTLQELEKARLIVIVLVSILSFALIALVAFRNYEDLSKFTRALTRVDLPSFDRLIDEI